MMTLAHELGKDLTEIRQMPLDEIFQWMAFFKVRNEEQEKLRKKHKPRGGRSGVISDIM
jgi:hypothetical protein